MINRLASICCGLLLVLLSIPIGQAVIGVRDGQVLWRRSGGDWPMVAVSVSSNGRYVAYIQQRFGPYISGQAEVNRSLYFLSVNGTVLWSVTSAPISGPLSVSPQGNLVCVAYGGGLAVFAGGRLLWNVTLPHQESAIALSVREDAVCRALTTTELQGTLSYLQFSARGGLALNSSLNGPFTEVRAVAWTEDGDYVAVANGARPVLLYDRRGTLLWSRDPVGGDINSLFVAPNASYVLVGSMDENYVTLYGHTGELLWFRKQDSPILEVTISPDDKNLVAGSRDGYIYYYNLGGELIHKEQFATSYGTYPLALSEDGQYVAAGLYENDVSLSTTNGTEVWRQQSGGPTGSGEELWIPSISYNAEQTAWFRGNDIELVNKKGGLVWQRSVEEAVDGLLISSTGNYVLVRLGAGNQYQSPCYPYYPNLSGGIVTLFDKQGDRLWSYDTKSHAYSISISNDGEYVAVGSDKLNLLNRHGQVEWSYGANGCFRTLSQFSTNGEFAAGAGSISNGFNRLYFFNKNGELLWSRDLFVRTVSLSGDGNHIAVGSYQGVYLFDRSGEQLWNYTLNSVLVEGISSTLDGKYVAAVGMNTTYNPSSGYYPLTGKETLYFFDGQGHFLWKKDGVGLPFSFSPDQGYASVSTGVFDTAGNQIWHAGGGNGYSVISSDGHYIAEGVSDYRLFYERMPSERSYSAGANTTIPWLQLGSIVLIFLAGLLVIAVLLRHRHALLNKNLDAPKKKAAYHVEKQNAS